MAELTITDSQPLPQPGALTIAKSEPLPQQKSVSGFAHNVLESTGALAKSVVQPFSSPEATGAAANGLFHVTRGLIEKGLNWIHPSGAAGTEQDTQLVDAVTQHYIERYGGLDKFADTFYKDPAGTAADVATFASLAGKGLQLAREVPVLGDAMSTVAKTAKATGTAVKAGASAAAPDVAIGTAKVAGGAAAAEVAKAVGAPGIVDFAAGYPLVRSGARQIVSGLKTGVEAGKAAFTDAAAAAEQTPGARLANILEWEPPTPIRFTREAPAAAPAAAAPAEDTALLEGLAQSQAGASFAKLSPEQQAAVRDLAQRIQNPAPSPPAAAAPSAAAPAAAAPPPVAPSTVAAAATPGKTIAEIAREELTPKPPADIAQQLFTEAQKSGTVPPEAKPGEPIGQKPPADTEDFKGKARTTRATSAETLAENFHQHEIPSDSLSAIETGQWKQIVDSIPGLKWPEGKAAQTKLIRETMKVLQIKEGETTSIGKMMGATK